MSNETRTFTLDSYEAGQTLQLASDLREAASEGIRHVELQVGQQRHALLLVCDNNQNIQAVYAAGVSSSARALLPAFKQTLSGALNLTDFHDTQKASSTNVHSTHAALTAGFFAHHANPSDAFAALEKTAGTAATPPSKTAAVPPTGERSQGLLGGLFKIGRKRPQPEPLSKKAEDNHEAYRHIPKAGG
jgi:hypothetical protein